MHEALGSIFNTAKPTKPTNSLLCWDQWFRPVILATWDIRRIEV
jgi:hypothetical protein